MFKNLKQKFTKFLEAIATQNQKQFGNQRMDCCDVNKKETVKKWSRAYGASEIASLMLVISEVGPAVLVKVKICAKSYFRVVSVDTTFYLLPKACGLCTNTIH